MNVTEITPCLMIKNEDYWIYYVLRDLSKVFGSRIIVLDTGSADHTTSIVKQYYPRIRLIRDDYGTDAEKIGNGRNVLRELCPTKWMFLVDGDEIWREDKLHKLLQQEVPIETKVVMAGNWNIEDVEGQLKLRTHDRAGKDILFTSDVKWNKTDYPFEGYGLGNDFPMEWVHYFPADQVFAWHVRTCIRSTQNAGAYFREEKHDFFPYDKEYQDLPEDWLGEINLNIRNHYLM